MIKILKNTTLINITLSDVGVTVLASGQHTIDPTEYGLFAKSTDTIGYLASSDIIMNNGFEDLVAIEGIAWLQGDYIFNTGAKEMKISNPVVGTDTVFSFQNNTKSFQIKAQNKAELTIKTQLGGAVYTIPQLCVWGVESLAFSGTVIYISSSIPTTTVEVLEFYN